MINFPQQQEKASQTQANASQETAAQDIQFGFPFAIPCIGSGSSYAQAQCQLIHRLAPSSTTIGLSGPSGSGKSSIAFLIHEQSPQNEKCFWEIDFSNSSDPFLDLQNPVALEHWIQSFAGGTLFLSHVECCKQDQQTVLLNLTKLLNSRRIKREFGATRFILGSEKSFDSLYTDGEIKAELFHTLQMVEVELSPLRGRISDILNIAEGFLAKASSEDAGYSFSSPALEQLLTYSWPENAEELLKVLNSATGCLKIDGRTTIEASDIEKQLTESTAPAAKTVKLKDAVRRFERKQIQQAIAQHQGSKEDAAEALGLSLASLYRKLA